MLGERRSKAAFSAGFPEAVREETRQDSGHLPEEIMETEASLDGFIETEERDEIYMALRGILDALTDGTLQKDALMEKFEQLRDF